MSRIDPSRTVSLRRRFEADFHKRLRKLSRSIHKWLVTDDELGLKKRRPLKLLQRTFQFRTNPQKIAAFRQWLQDQVNQGLITLNRAGVNWTDTYIESAYKKGLERSYIQANKAKLLQPAGFLQGSREEFLRSSFFQPETLEKVQLLATRTFEELKDISAVMSQQIGRQLADGLVNGYGPAKIARNIDNAIIGIDRKRARVLARTEIIHAHAEGQLDGFEKLGIDEVQAEVEWLTAGDEKVCTQCLSIEGKRFKVKNAHGMIPLHPNCRCAWIPVVEVPKEPAKASHPAPIKRDQSFKQGGKSFTHATMTKTDIGAMKEYQSGLYKSDVGGFGPIQRFLRDDTIAKYLRDEGVTRAKMKKYVTEIDDAIRKSVAAEDIVVLRGIRSTAETFRLTDPSKLKVGLKVKDPSYMSTTTSQKVVKRFAEKLNHGDDPRVLHITVPKGKRAMPMNLINDIGEAEVVLPRNSTIEITRITGKNIYVTVL